MDDLRFYALLSIFFTYIRTLEECSMDPCLSLVKFPPPELRDSGLEKKKCTKNVFMYGSFFNNICCSYRSSKED